MSSNLAIEEIIEKGASRLQVFLELIKARLTLMVLITATMGFHLAVGAVDWALLFHTLFGTGLLAGGAAALNQYLEKLLNEMQNNLQKVYSLVPIAVILRHMRRYIKHI